MLFTSFIHTAVRKAIVGLRRREGLVEDVLLQAVEGHGLGTVVELVGEEGGPGDERAQVAQAEHTEPVLGVALAGGARAGPVCVARAEGSRRLRGAVLEVAVVEAGPERLVGDERAGEEAQEARGHRAGEQEGDEAALQCGREAALHHRQLGRLPRGVRRAALQRQLQRLQAAPARAGRKLVLVLPAVLVTLTDKYSRALDDSPIALTQILHVAAAVEPLQVADNLQVAFQGEVTASYIQQVLPPICFCVVKFSKTC